MKKKKKKKKENQRREKEIDQKSLEHARLKDAALLAPDLTTYKARRKREKVDLSLSLLHQSGRWKHGKSPARCCWLPFYSGAIAD